MKKSGDIRVFLKRFVIFSVPVFLASLVTFGVYLAVKHKVDARLEKMSACETLIMGDSQMQRINGNFFSSNTKNLASSGEHFFITYEKLKQILSVPEPKLERIVLGVSVHSFAPVYNRMLDLSFPEGKRSWERYLYFLSSFTAPMPFDVDKAPMINSLEGIYKGPDWGGLFESEHSNPDTATIDQIYKMHFSRKGNAEMFCENQKEYLYMIDSLCKANNITLFLCSTPYHPDYKKRIPDEYFDFFYETMSHFNPEQHINFLADSSKPQWMSDANHLNITGAKVYSEKINQIIHQ
ncbi:MAG: hypothetical protein PF489_14470 [Salinivirgaceae bacterium]|jgi:hypothetical protein|nr:hypothetical protein [Salinivirgaceae bacterium]